MIFGKSYIDQYIITQISSSIVMKNNTQGMNSLAQAQLVHTVIFCSLVRQIVLAQLALVM